MLKSSVPILITSLEKRRFQQISALPKSVGTNLATGT